MNLRTSASSAAALGFFLPAIAPLPNPLGQAISFRRQISPILAANCNACHAKSSPQSRLDSTSFNGLMKGGKRGKAVIPGNPKGSLLVQYVDGTRQPRMPIGGALQASEIALIKKWIAEGARTDGEPSNAT